MIHADGPRTGRPSVFAMRGMVSAPHYLASASGQDALRRGGSAVDAAIAISATLCVVYPHMAGLGGDAFWLIAGGGASGVEAIEATGPAARLATRDFYSEAGYTDQIPMRGALAALTTPGVVDGVVAPKSPDISHGAAWAAMNSRGERYPSDLCG